MLDVRNRASSQRSGFNSSISKEERSVIASAMRTLQEKIVQLEKEKDSLLKSKAEAA